MQIAIEAQSNQFILASDTKARKRNGSSGGKRSPDEVSFESKVRVSGKHTVAVAISGRPLLNTDPAQEFVDYIATVSRIPESLVDVTEEWTKEYQDRHTGWDWWGFKLLIVNPNSKYEPIVTVEVAKRLDDCANQSKIKALPFSGFRISGNEINSAIMWPEYCRCGIQPLPDLETGTNIAALTILMGAEHAAPS